jgi:hypothetical protein
LWLQWRGITIVVFILVDVIFFSVVFVYMNQVEKTAATDLEGAMPFLMCLVQHADDVSKCNKLGQDLFVNQSTVLAVLILLSLAGIQCFILLARSSMFPAWWKLIRSKFGSKREFVSLDAKQATTDLRNYELAKIAQSPIKAPDSAITSPGADYSPYGRSTPDYFGKEVQREYRSPTLSFSTPRAPSQQAMRVEWDPRATHARGGLGLHPVDDEDEDEDYDYTRHRI